MKGPEQPNNEVPIASFEAGKEESVPIQRKEQKTIDTEENPAERMWQETEIAAKYAR